MRTITGALLIVAASVCFGAGIVGMAIWQNRAGFDPSGLGFLAAFVLGLFGVMLLLAGLATDPLGPHAESRAMPRWLWITLLVCVLAVLAILAITAIGYFMPRGKDQGSRPNQALQQTAGHETFLGLHSSPVPRRC